MEDLNAIIREHLMDGAQWALYNGLTYKIVRSCMVDFAPGYILSRDGKEIRVEKSWVEAY